MMNKLYWKIFVWFWLAMIMFIATTAWVSDYFIHVRVTPLQQDNMITQYANAAVSIYESAGEKSLIHWLHRIKRKRHINLYLLDANNIPLFNAPLPENLTSFLAKLSLNKNLRAYKQNNMVISPLITSDGGVGYKLIAEYNRPLPKFNFPISFWWICFLLAIIISGIICYLMSRYLTNPLYKLQSAAIQFAKGQLDVRVTPLLGNRQDEITDLAKEFDNMASHIANSIHTQNRLMQDISHELRTPLARLQVALELAQRNPVGSTKQLQRIETEIYKMNRLIEEIMNLSRLANELPIHKEKVDLGLLLQTIIQDSQFEFAKHQKPIHFKIDSPIELNTDQKLLTRALENIIRNSIRYAHKEIHITIKRTPKILIQIEDDGPGVPEDQLIHIFKPFYRVDEDRNQQSGGYGLGLSIAREAVSLLNGEIKAINCHPKGLMIKICFDG